MMYEDYVKDHKILEKTEEDYKIELIKTIINTKKDLERASKNYEYAEGELIDYYLYQIKANQSKLNYLIKNAKNSGIILDMINEIEIRKFEDIKVV